MYDIKCLYYYSTVNQSDTAEREDKSKILLHFVCVILCNLIQMNHFYEIYIESFVMQHIIEDLVYFDMQKQFQFQY